MTDAQSAAVVCPFRRDPNSLSGCIQFTVKVKLPILSSHHLSGCIKALILRNGMTGGYYADKIGPHHRLKLMMLIFTD